jgi:hypothetical protein
MARVHKSILLSGLSGKLDGLVFRTVRGKISVYTLSPRSKPLTEKQLAYQEKFKEAVAFAKGILANPELRQQYTQRAKTEKKRNAYTLAVAERMGNL